jgi:hypothetical protein
VAATPRRRQLGTPARLTQIGYAVRMTVAAQIRRALDDDRTPSLVEAYFNDAGPFAGLTFDRLKPNDPHSFGPDDLLAVTLLDVSCSPPAVRALLAEDRTRWRSMLEAVSPTRYLWEMVEDRQLYDDANALWQSIRALPVGPTTTGKLLARKRPHLVPIHDSVVHRYLGTNANAYWLDIAEALTDVDLRRRIDALWQRDEQRPSTIRLLDVAVWMQCSGSRNARRARGGRAPLA